MLPLRGDGRAYAVAVSAGNDLVVVGLVPRHDQAGVELALGVAEGGLGKVTAELGLPGLLVARLLDKPVVLQAEVNGEMSGEVYTWGTPFATGTAAYIVS